MLTFGQTSGHFTKCFGSQLHQVLHLCSKEPRAISGTFIATDRVLYHSGVGTLYARRIFREQEQQILWLEITRFVNHVSYLLLILWGVFEGRCHQVM